jgi:toxin FitB
VIVLDTNVLSALMLAQPDPTVLRWLDGRARETFWTTAVTVMEIRLGLEALAPGRRRTRLEEEFVRVLEDDLEDRVLPFDRDAAEAAAVVGAKRRREGRPREVHDTQIAGIVIARRASLATRNTRHFDDLGVELVDPWSA